MTDLLVLRCWSNCCPRRLPAVRSREWLGQSGTLRAFTTGKAQAFQISIDVDPESAAVLLRIDSLVHTTGH